MHTLYAKAYRQSFTVGGSFLNFIWGRQKTFYHSEIHSLIKPSVIRFWQAAESALVDSHKIQFCFTFSCALLKDNYLWWQSDVHRLDRHTGLHTHTHDGWQLLTALTYFSSCRWKLITRASRHPKSRELEEYVSKTFERQGRRRRHHERHWTWKL